MKLILVLLLTLIANSAYAVPDQLVVAGIAPGVTSQKEFEDNKTEVGTIIGGFKLICIPKYDDKSILDKLICYTGKEYSSQDTTKDYINLASNLNIHETLLKGFTKKFGKPIEVLEVPVQTGLGVEYTRMSIKWKDSIGNELTLINMSKKVDTGLVILTSAKKIKQEKEKGAKGEKQRNF